MQAQPHNKPKLPNPDGLWRNALEITQDHNPRPKTRPRQSRVADYAGIREFGRLVFIQSSHYIRHTTPADGWVLGNAPKDNSL